MSKIARLIIGGAAASIVLFASLPGEATPYTMNLGVNDPAGTQTGPGNGPPLSDGVQTDGSAGGHATLQYALANNGANQMVAGDVLIYCDPNHTDLMEVLRFEDFGVGYVFVYATPAGGPNLADTGLPTALQANTVAFTQEFNGTSYGLFDYTPTAGQPGYSTDNFTSYNGFTYDFTSDGNGNWSTPDGGTTAALLGAALLALGALQRRLA
jgi:hypothetical protein